MSPSITVRTASVAESPALAELAARTFWAAYAGDVPEDSLRRFVAANFSPERQAAEVADPDAHYLVAEAEGELVGYAFLQPQPPPEFAPQGPALLLSRLYVEEGYQGAGVGRALMARIREIAEAGGYQLVWLLVWEHNPRAIAVYRRWGFVDVGGVDFDFEGDPQTDRVMVLTL